VSTLFRRTSFWKAGAVAVLLALVALAVEAEGAHAQQARSGDGDRVDSTATAERTPFALQINASEDAALVASQLDSLRRRGVPAYRTQTTTDAGVTFHRLRVGPFRGRRAARAFARCQGYTDPWIVPAARADANRGAANRDAAGRVVSDVATDVVPLRPRPPRVLLGRGYAFVAFLMPPYGDAPEGTQPATLRVYTPARDTPAVVEHVTGVRETDGALAYGRAERVFLRDPGRDTSAAGDHADEVEAFSRRWSVSSYIVRDQIAFYNGGRVARFTLLGTLPLPDGAPTLHEQPGFDYVDAQGRTVRYQGRTEPDRTRTMGHARTRRLLQSAPTQMSTKQAALFARPTARDENAQVCLLFFAE
jgi:hypothetical protein